MTEPVGATLGVLGLAGLFTVCVNCFDYVQSGRAIGKDCALIDNQLSAIRLRLFAWGKTTGLTNPTGYDHRLDDFRWRQHVRQQLSGISLLFLDSVKLIRRYELEERYYVHTDDATGVN